MIPELFQIMFYRTKNNISNDTRLCSVLNPVILGQRIFHLGSLKYRSWRILQVEYFRTQEKKTWPGEMSVILSRSGPRGVAIYEGHRRRRPFISQQQNPETQTYDGRTRTSITGKPIIFHKNKIYFPFSSVTLIFRKISHSGYRRNYSSPTS